MRAVARNWVEGRVGKPSTDDGDPLTAASQAEIDRRAGLRVDEEPEIGVDDAPAVTLFLSMSTQWRREAMSGLRTGLIYEAMPPLMNMLDITSSPELLHGVRIMEAEALNRMAARR